MLDAQAVPRQISRSSFLRLGAAGALGGLGAVAVGGAAASAAPAPAPQGDDVGFLAFAVVAERATLVLYRGALPLRGAFSAAERRHLAAVRAAKRDHVERLNAVLGADAVARGDLDVALPARRLRSRAGVCGLGEDLEGLLVAVHLEGVSAASDPGTRLLLGRLLAFDQAQLTWLRAVSGRVGRLGLPAPLDVDAAGARLDRFLAVPDAAA